MLTCESFGFRMNVYICGTPLPSTNNIVKQNPEFPVGDGPVEYSNEFVSSKTSSLTCKKYCLQIDA